MPNLTPVPGLGTSQDLPMATCATAPSLLAEIRLAAPDSPPCFVSRLGHVAIHRHIAHIDRVTMMVTAQFPHGIGL